MSSFFYLNHTIFLNRKIQDLETLFKDSKWILWSSPVYFSPVVCQDYTGLLKDKYTLKDHRVWSYSIINVHRVYYGLQFSLKIQLLSFQEGICKWCKIPLYQHFYRNFYVQKIIHHEWIPIAHFQKLHLAGHWNRNLRNDHLVIKAKNADSHWPVLISCGILKYLEWAGKPSQSSVKWGLHSSAQGTAVIGAGQAVLSRCASCASCEIPAPARSERALPRRNPGSHPPKRKPEQLPWSPTWILQGPWCAHAVFCSRTNPTHRHWGRLSHVSISSLL